MFDLISWKIHKHVLFSKSYLIGGEMVISYDKI